MIKTTIKWYTLDEKLPYDGEILADYDNTEILCKIEFTMGSMGGTLSFNYIDQMDWIDGKVMQLDDGEWVDYTEQVKYWAYVPEIGVE